MNLLKQTSLILGLASLSIGGWVLYRNWRQKITIIFSILCFSVAVWALSFVSWVTLNGRLSRDVHWFFHVWISPIGVMLLSEVFSRHDRVGRVLQSISFGGALILSLMIAFSVSLPESLSPWFWNLVSFWPSFILFEFLYLMAHDFILTTLPTSQASQSSQAISFGKRKILYIGLGVSLLICSFDHIPFFGLVIPSIGNLFFTAFLVFLGQMITPQKFLRVDSPVSRFLAVVILSLIITGFFALLYQYMSETFPLFLLNSFLISFSVLALWPPLVSFFKFLGNKIGKGDGLRRTQSMERFRVAIASVTDLETLNELVQNALLNWLGAREVKISILKNAEPIPALVEVFLSQARQRKVIPILHRELIQTEREQVLVQQQKEELDHLIQYLNFMECDLIFPIYLDEEMKALVLVSEPSLLNEWDFNLSFYSKVFEVLQGIGSALVRLGKIEVAKEKAKEKERFIVLGEMAAGLAHEIRNPLGAIQGAVELLEPNSNNWVKIIHEEVNRLNRLVSQFLDFANPSNDKLEVCNLVEVVERTVDRARLMVQNSAQIEFHFESPEVRVRAIPDHLQQILLNLIQNSMKATQHSTNQKIKIEVLSTGAFRVSDSGIGIPQKDIKKVFQPFFTSFQDGTGLGLAICERLIDLNGGKIEINSELGKGTQVTVQLEAKQ